VSLVGSVDPQRLEDEFLGFSEHPFQCLCDSEYLALGAWGMWELSATARYGTVPDEVPGQPSLVDCPARGDRPVGQRSDRLAVQDPPQCETCAAAALLFKRIREEMPEALPVDPADLRQPVHRLADLASRMTRRSAAAV
jgi:hypothetical protein